MGCGIIEAKLSLFLFAHQPTLPNTSLEPGVDRTSKNPGRHEAPLQAIITRLTALNPPFPQTRGFAVIDEIKVETD